MGSDPALSTKDHERFCRIDGWQPMTSARGKGRDHRYYEKRLPDGRRLETKISHGAKSYGPGLTNQVVKQLGLSNVQELFQSLRSGRPAERTPALAETTPAEATAAATPAWLVDRLVKTAKVPTERVMELSHAEAQQAWDNFCTHRVAFPSEPPTLSAQAEVSPPVAQQPPPPALLPTSEPLPLRAADGDRSVQVGGIEH